MKSTVFGVGVNDADYFVNPHVGDSRKICVFYQTWHNMLRRCYSEVTQLRQPTYKGCTVVKTWHRFSTFKKWMALQDWEGKVLDKDILVRGNKVYSPSKCIFVSSDINALLRGRASNRTRLPTGVRRVDKKYGAEIRHGGNYRWLGVTDTIDEASALFCRAKSDILRKAGMDSSDPRLSVALLSAANNKDGVYI